jgi:hypothetical protein
MTHVGIRKLVILHFPPCDVDMDVDNPAQEIKFSAYCMLWAWGMK